MIVLCKKIIWIYHNLFNLRLGWLAIPIIGGMVAGVNYHHGLSEAIRAGAVAGFTGLLITGTMTRIIQHFALWQNRTLSYLCGSGIPTATTILLHLGGQSVNHTPELFWSVIAPTLLTFITSVLLNLGTHFFNKYPNPTGPLAKICKYFFVIPGQRS